MGSQAPLLKKSLSLGKRHLEVMDELESMLDQGKSFSTMSDLAKKLKISLKFVILAGAFSQMQTSRETLFVEPWSTWLRK